MTANAAFEILYREYYVRVFGLCRRLLNSPTLAEDATQEVFMRAYRNFDSYDNQQPFWQWIAAIVKNHCIDLLRQRSRAQNLFEDDEQDLEFADDQQQPALSTIINAEDNKALMNAIEQLPDKYRVPLVLAYFKEASYDEIAEDLSVSRNHVGVLLLRAKLRLRAAIADTVQTEQQG